ncbi:hypothetical protein [Cellulomonas sp. URHB0016]
MKRAVKAVVAAVALGALAAASIGAVRLNAPHDPGPADTASMSTAVVERGALAAGMRLTGTLTRGDVTPLSGSGHGVLTALPPPGAQISAGQVLYEVDGQPVFLLSGPVPLWRALKLGDTGKDVLTLTTALAALGHGDGASDVFDAATSAAVADLYRAAGETPPTETDEGKKAIADAQAALDAAQKSVAAARKGLAAADSPPDAVEVAQADAAVAEAAAALDEATASGASTALAQAQLDAARAARSALDAAPDVAAQKQAVDEAVAQVAAAKAALGVARAQSVGPEQLTVLSAASIRVESVGARLGGPASGEILQWTGMTTFVQAPVTASQQSALAIGTTVQVTLPSGGQVQGTVASVGSTTAAAAAADGKSGDGAKTAGDGAGGTGAKDGSASATKPALHVDVADQAAVAALAGSAVTVEVSTDVAEDALIVPVTALLALAEGGYAVERVTRGGHVELVGVKVGLIAEARVQVTGGKLKAGDRVRIP